MATAMTSLNTKMSVEEKEEFVRALDGPMPGAKCVCGCADE